MILGRPSEYSQEIVDKAKVYLEVLPEDEVLPSIEGLACFLDIARSTIYEWEKDADKKAFSDIIDKLRSIQGKTLINQGVSGKFNSTITKVLLTKHGYREGIEQSGENGAPIKVDITKMLDKAYGDTPEMHTDS